MYTHLLQYAAVDKTGQCVAVAGKTGLAHYTFSTRKWKLFGNETQVHVTVYGLRQNTPLLMSTDKNNLLIVYQEKDLVVSGGMTWWKDFICVACYNIIGQRDEVMDTLEC